MTTTKYIPEEYKIKIKIVRLFLLAIFVMLWIGMGGKYLARTEGVYIWIGVAGSVALIIVWGFAEFNYSQALSEDE